ncbi:MAG: hypothetical protein RLY14_3291, partial [Planctomycetota bacterium]
MRIVPLCFVFVVVFCLVLSKSQLAHAQLPNEFLKTYCYSCHSSKNSEAGLDFETLGSELVPEMTSRWVRIHDRLASMEMPPRDAEQPRITDRMDAIKALKDSIIATEEKTAKDIPNLRRLTRSEYENTIRDLFEMPGIALAGILPADGQSHGFDKHPEALDISHVNIAKYLEAADHILNYAIATRPGPPTIQNRRISLVNRGGFVAHIVMNGDGILLKNGQPDPDFPPAAEQNHLDQGAHERWGSFTNGASVGLFRHEDESVSPYFIEHVTIYPGKYRIRTSLWSFQWDQGTMLPGRGTEAARLSVVQLTGDGRGGQHPSYVLGYFNAPNQKPLEHEIYVWMNHNELIGFNAASLAPAANYYKKKRAMEFTGPGIVVDWLDVEGPLYETWPPLSHKRLFDELPLVEFKAEDQPNIRYPQRKRPPQIGAGMNRPDPEPGIWTVSSEKPLEDADRLLANFLPRLFRRPISTEIRNQYVAIVKERLESGDCFEEAMRAAYRNALIAPDFLMHIESLSDGNADYALACRLSYFLWNSLPDERLVRLAASGDLRRKDVLHNEVERLLEDPRSTRFVNDFVGQWLKLNQIAATDPDKKLYPEFSPYLQDSMVAETRAYFRELLEQDLNASHLIKSDFVMINEKLAAHYGIQNVVGTQIRRVPLPVGCPRGGFLTQASILKITSNGTTTSPVPRGAFVMDRLLGETPEPPPANVSAIEPDVLGATTIREQLAKHRDHAVCASCHQRIDPPGFALEAFDVIGGFRKRYRSIGDGDPAERGSIDPMISIGFKLGQPVDSTGVLTDGRVFEDIQSYQSLMASDSKRLLTNLAIQLAIYATGKAVRFSDRPFVDEIVARTEQQNGGVRTLLHELIVSPLFTRNIDVRLSSAPESASIQAWKSSRGHKSNLEATYPSRNESQHFLMSSMLAPLDAPVSKKESSETQNVSQKEYEFDKEHPMKWRVIGLFTPERIDSFRMVLEQFPEVRLQLIDFEHAEATLRIASDSDLFRNANAEQITERLNNQVRHLSSSLFSLRPLGDISHDKLERIEFKIIGLDCHACSLAVHDIL